MESHRLQPVTGLTSKDQTDNSEVDGKESSKQLKSWQPLEKSAIVQTCLKQCCGKECVSHTAASGFFEGTQDECLHRFNIF